MSRRPADEARLDAYLDNLLSPQEARDFERQLREDATLREQLSLAREIEASLARAFPGNAANSETVDRVRRAARQETAAGAPPRAARWKLFVAATAAGVACVVAGWQVFRGAQPDNRRPYRLVTFQQIYDDSVASGFRPTWLCEDDREFVETFEKRQGKGILLADLPPNMKMAGLAYKAGVSPQTTTLMMWVDEQPVMVFVERLDRDRPKEAPPASSGLNLFRREKWGLVFYELSPFDKPRVIELLTPVNSADLPPDDEAKT